MPTHRSINETAPGADTNNVAPGEIATALVWIAFYAAIFTVPVAAKFAPVGTVIAFLSR